MEKITLLILSLFFITTITAGNVGVSEMTEGKVVYIPPESTTTSNGSINITNNYFNNFDQSLNTTENVTFVNVTATGWFNGLFNWSINTVSSAWLQFTGSVLTFNETKLNETIDLRTSNKTSWWDRVGTILSPSNEGDKINATGDIILNNQSVGITNPTQSIKMFIDGNGAFVISG